MGTSVREWLDQTLAHDEVKEFVQAAFRVATYTNAPDLMSAGAAIEQLKKALATGVLYVDGGWQTLVEGLREAAERAGALIETGVKVEAVKRHASGAVAGIRLAGGRLINASTVLIASSPALAARLVENSEHTSLSRWADQAIPVRAACLDVALSRLPIPTATFALGIDRPLYKVLRLILGLAAKSVAEPRFAFRILNGLPAVLVEDYRSTTTTATRYTIHIELNDESRIRRLHVVVAPGKLTALT